MKKSRRTVPPNSTSGGGLAWAYNGDLYCTL